MPAMSDSWKVTGAEFDDAVPSIEDVDAVFGLGISDLYL